MDQELTPGEVAGRRFRQAFRGFDPDEVGAYLATVARQLEELVAQRDRLAGRLGDFAERDLKSEFAIVGQEVAAVLDAAREAAEGMRERAATDAARWRTEALAETESERRAASTDAEHLRTDAWTTSEELLRQAQAEARHILEAAERDSLSVLGEAEREAHRLTAGARREAEDLMRSTRMDAEKITAEAKSRQDEIIESARRQAEAAQERARALEQRRQELIGELETLRSTLSRMDGELDERRSRLGLSAASEAIEDEKVPLRVVRPDEPAKEEGDWEPGETVRVVPTRRPQSELPKISDSEEVVAEVRRLRQGSLPQARPLIETSSTETIDAEVGEGEVLEEEPIVSGPDRVEAPPDPVEVAAAEPAPAEASLDEVTDIFRRLRGEGAGPPSPESPPLTPIATSPPPTPSKPQPVSDVDPFDLRERLLLPVTNRARRSVKRQLTELQNLALEELRVSGGSWRPDESTLVEQLRPDVVVLLAEAFSMGHSAAEEMLGKGMPRPPTPSRDEAAGLGSTLAGQLVTVMESGDEEGARELSASVSRVFRGWRTDEA
ncbi:MAG: DivIVA domain-containing protein, partial [Acidimicrobiia bacterium]|nr:DivIVA domain-containing protein [Acidimicrobiia bacterium]